MLCGEAYIRQYYFIPAQKTLDLIELNMRNLFVVLLLLVITVINLNKSMETWQERNNFLDYDDLNKNYLEDKCADNELCQNNIEDLIKKKSKENEDTLFQADINGKKMTRSNDYHSSHPMSCSCGIEYSILDLGHQYYPRYLHTGACKPGICVGLYRCIEKHYKAPVLKRRDPRSPEVKTAMAIPDNLKSIWQPELVTVTVACECSLYS